MWSRYRTTCRVSKEDCERRVKITLHRLVRKKGKLVPDRAIQVDDRILPGRRPPTNTRAVIDLPAHFCVEVEKQKEDLTKTSKALLSENNATNVAATKTTEE